MKRVFKLNKPEWMFIVLGCLSAIISGGVQPAFGVILSRAIAVSLIEDLLQKSFKISINLKLDIFQMRSG